MNVLLLALIVLLLVGGVGFSPVVGSSYGWGPSGGLGVVVLILVLWMIFGGGL